MVDDFVAAHRKLIRENQVPRKGLQKVIQDGDRVPGKIVKTGNVECKIPKLDLYLVVASDEHLGAGLIQENVGQRDVRSTALYLPRINVELPLGEARTWGLRGIVAGRRTSQRRPPEQNLSVGFA